MIERFPSPSSSSGGGGPGLQKVLPVEHVKEVARIVLQL